jgi:hypothetical protein
VVSVTDAWSTPRYAVHVAYFAASDGRYLHTVASDALSLSDAESMASAAIIGGADSPLVSVNVSIVNLSL